MHYRPPAMFIADSLALDFLNSRATPLNETIDWLDGGLGLLDWMQQAGIVATGDSERFQAEALPGELDHISAQTRSLREWFRGFVEARKGRPLTPRDIAALEPLNRLLERDENFAQIVAIDGGLRVRQMRRWKSAEALLLPIAEALAHCVCEENFTLVRNCQGLNCTLMFVDHTRRRDRRWCSMAVCGNRAKQQEFRERRKHRA